jgi:DNA modification methylase
MPGLKPKDMIGIPWMVAFALRADGWYLRQDIIWSKPNPMPESVTDRCTKAHEYIFLFSKSARYFYDVDAIREPITSGDKRVGRNSHALVDPSPKARKGIRSSDPERFGLTRGTTNQPCSHPLGRNKRSVWEIASNPFPDAHFATFPPALIEPCIKAGCPAGGAVLDPFGGAGTSALVAASLGRSATLIELNPEYVKLARARIEAEFMGKEEGARHMIRSLGKIVTTFEPGSLFAGLEVELPATASEIRTPEPTESIDPGQIATGGPEEERPSMETSRIIKIVRLRT